MWLVVSSEYSWKMNYEIGEATPATLNGSSLALFRIPFIFSQDQLLKSDEFIRQSSERGYPLSLSQLETLHLHKLLIPLFYIDDTANERNRIPIQQSSMSTLDQMIFNMAAEGRVRDCSQDNFSAASQFELPPNTRANEWRKGYIYSSWQLNRIPVALNSLKQIELAEKDGVKFDRHDQFRSNYLALSALATIYLPGILGQLESPGENQELVMRKFMSDVETKDCLAVSGLDPQFLKGSAEAFLNQARMNDPLINWWPLIRHSNITGWKKLKGIPLHCVWLRISAEIFLRAHEDLARIGLLDPLPDLERVQYRQSLHDRITPHWENERPLEAELAVFGLSPHPRVLVLVEGHTEEIHFNALLKEIGLNNPDRVRIQNAEGSTVNSDLLSRYVIAPRPSHFFSEYQGMLPPTVFVIAMDPENGWETSEGQEKKKQVIRNAIKREVARQGAKLTEQELDHLVTVFVWPDETYEFANFTDEELLEGMVKLTLIKKPAYSPTLEWKMKVMVAIKEARALRCQFIEKVGPIGVPDDKPQLAKILLPTLVAKFHKENKELHYVTPVFQVIEKIQALYAQFASGVFIFKTKRE